MHTEQARRCMHVCVWSHTSILHTCIIHTLSYTQGELEDAAGQFEFLNEIHSGSNPSSELAYIGALLANRKDKDVERTIAKLDETVRVQMEVCACSLCMYAHVDMTIAKLDETARVQMEVCAFVCFSCMHTHMNGAFVELYESIGVLMRMCAFMYIFVRMHVWIQQQCLARSSWACCHCIFM
jgi:hypothetical protein